jgi:cysteine synthase
MEFSDGPESSGRSPDFFDSQQTSSLDSPERRSTTAGRLFEMAVLRRQMGDEIVCFVTGVGSGGALQCIGKCA